MSIRPEDAAAEASRFSLRGSFFGKSVPLPVPLAAQVQYQPPQPSVQLQTMPLAAQMHPRSRPSPTAAPPAAQTTFSFQSLVGTKSPNVASQQAARNLQTQRTMQAITRIADDQKMRTAFSNTPGISSIEFASASSRTLPSGFINGGNQRLDSQAEVLRLSAAVDSLNSKLASQSDRLQRTEASLVRANRSITSERAISNARLLRMQTEVKDLRSRESSIRESALAQARSEAQTPAPLFGDAAKRAEEYDAKLVGLEQTVHTLSGEKTSLAARISSLSGELEKSTVRADAAETKLSASTTEAVDSAASIAQIAELSNSIQAATTAKAELTERLALVESKYAVAVAEFETASVLQHGTQTSLQTEVASLLEQNIGLQAQLDEICKFPVGDTSNTSDATYTDTDIDGTIDMAHSSIEALKAELHVTETAMSMALDEFDASVDKNTSKGYTRIGKLANKRHLIQSELLARGHCPGDDASTTAAAASLRKELEENEVGLRTVGRQIGCYSSDDGAEDRERWIRVLQVADRYHHSAEFEDDGDDDDDPDLSQVGNTIVFQSSPSAVQTHVHRGGHAPHPVGNRIATAMARTGTVNRLMTCINPMTEYRLNRAKFGSTTTPTGNSPPIPPDVAKLIEAVSKDISIHCIRQRRNYLEAVGMAPQAIKDELKAYS